MRVGYIAALPQTCCVCVCCLHFPQPVGVAARCCCCCCHHHRPSLVVKAAASGWWAAAYHQIPPSSPETRSCVAAAAVAAAAADVAAAPGRRESPAAHQGQARALCCDAAWSWCAGCLTAALWQEALAACEAGPQSRRLLTILCSLLSTGAGYTGPGRFHQTHHVYYCCKDPPHTLARTAPGLCLASDCDCCDQQSASRQTD